MGQLVTDRERTAYRAGYAAGQVSAYWRVMGWWLKLAARRRRGCR